MFNVDQVPTYLFLLFKKKKSNNINTNDVYLLNF